MTTKLNELFKRARKAKLIARQNYLCCSGCASAQIATDLTKAIDAGRTGQQGCLFYHRQDAEALDSRREDARLALRYGSVWTEKHGRIGMETVDVGRMLVGMLDDMGVRYDWDGKPETVIYINVRDALAEAPEAHPEPTRLPRPASKKLLASQADRQALADNAAGRILAAVDGEV